MEINRGDVVICASPGDDGKPRPAVVVQSDLFNETHASVVICPITSESVDAPLFRIAVAPKPGTGLHATSQIMVDKVTALRRERIAKRVGRPSADDVTRLNTALRLWLGLDPGL